jgi:hypothetical protein
MRCLIAAGAIAAIVLGATAAQAEKRVFIIANNADGYGVDRCLASGGGCGTTVANSYCRSREFAQALSFRKVDRDDITGDIPSGGTSACPGGACDNFVAIECSR